MNTKNIFKHAILTVLTASMIVLGCRKDPEITDDGLVRNGGGIGATSISFNIPAGWPMPFYNFSNNTLTQAGFELGRKLFYDPRLSRNNTISCGTCHQQFAAFSNFEHPRSHGIDDSLGNRNSPPIFNLNWHTSFFWDGGVNHIESQPINPIQNPVEMDANLPDIINKLKADADYRARFNAAFGNDTINSQRIFKAFAQFMGAMVSSNSKYDKYKRGEAGGEMTASELNGYQVFKENCASCHAEPLFTDFSIRNNGLRPSSILKDSGRAHITHDPADLYKFKVPTLRNLKYTAEYMHDGRFESLDQVIVHYTFTMDTTMPTIDTLLKTKMVLTDVQKVDLLKFLNTLNDEVFVKDPRFAEPK